MAMKSQTPAAPPPPPPEAVFDSHLPCEAPLCCNAWDYVGRRVCKFFPATELNPVPGWWFGVIKGVTFEGDPADPVVYYYVRYTDTDKEEFYWNELRQHLLVKGSCPELEYIMGWPLFRDPYADPVVKQEQPEDAGTGTAAAAAAAAGARAAAIKGEDAPEAPGGQQQQEQRRQWQWQWQRQAAHPEDSCPSTSVNVGRAVHARAAAAAAAGTAGAATHDERPPRPVAAAPVTAAAARKRPAGWDAREGPGAAWHANDTGVDGDSRGGAQRSDADASTSIQGDGGGDSGGGAGGEGGGAAAPPPPPRMPPAKHAPRDMQRQPPTPLQQQRQQQQQQGGGCSSVKAARRRDAANAGEAEAGPSPAAGGPTPTVYGLHGGRPEDGERAAAGRNVRRRLALDGDEAHALHDSPASPASPHGGRPKPQAAVRGRRQQAGDPSGGACWPAGHLLRIQLINFMCHSNMEVDFGQHATFITGHNGSGKSAVLQGLQACLGVAARATGRGSGVAGWVKQGRRAASVTVDIANTPDGEDEAPSSAWGAFKHSLYGPRIRIERRIRATGGGSYHLYDAQGQEVRPAQLGGRTVVQELRELVSHFNIEASNPLTIITQDMVKRFNIERHGPSTKYEMFMGGTGLADTAQRLAGCGMKLEAAKEHLQAAQGTLKAKEDALQQLEQRAARLRELESLEELLPRLERAYTWALVISEELGLAQQREAVAARPQRVPELERQARLRAEERDELVEQERAKRARLAETRPAEVQRAIDDAKAEVQAAGKQWRKALNDVEETEADLAKQGDDLATMDHQLAQLAASAGSEQALQRLAEYQAKLGAAAGELAAARAAGEALKREREALQAELEAARGAAKAAREGITACQRELAELQVRRHELLSGEASGRASVWGAQQDALRQLVEHNRSQFTRPPIGPVGAYLQVAPDCPEQYRAPLEVALSSIFASWLVNDHRDTYPLKQMCAAAGMAGGGGGRPGGTPTMIVAPFKDRPHLFPGACVGPVNGLRYLRAIDLVRVAGATPMVAATVTNALLDVADAANIVMVEQRSDAQAVAQTETQAAGPLVRAAYDAGCTRYERRGRTMLTIANRRPNVLRLGTDTRAQVAQVDAEVARVQAELLKAQAAERAAAQAEESARARVAGVRERLVQHATAESSAQGALKSLQSEAPVSAEDESQDLNNYRTGLASRIEASQQLLSQRQAEADALEQRHKHAVAKVEQLKAQANEYRLLRATLLDELAGLAARSSAAADAARAAEAELQAARAEAGGAALALQQREAFMAIVVQEAEAVCPRAEGEACLREVRARGLQELRDRAATRRKRGGAAAAACGSGGGGSAQRPRKRARAGDEGVGNGDGGGGGEEAYADDEALARELDQALQHKALEGRLQRLRARVAAAREQAGGDLDALNMQLQAARRDVARQRKAVTAVGIKVEALTKGTRLRADKNRELRESTERIADAKFRTYMTRRGWFGQVHLDHDARTLQLTVRKAGERQKAAALSQLSGGERSYTTCCFLVAMGEVCDSPFRCMDEFDVFMDGTNRAMATRTLLEFAWLVASKRQLILLSPQDTSTLNEALGLMIRDCEDREQDVPPDHFMVVKRMRDPRQPAAAGQAA